MYLEYFSLKRHPFRITPDPSLFFPGGVHGRGVVLDALVYGITSGEGILKVVGEVGSGKTMLCRMLEERLPDSIKIVYLANPSLSARDIVYAIAIELGLEVDAGTDRLLVMHKLQEYLLNKHSEGGSVVVFIEEAQSMPLETLEEVRLLSNLETHRHKLMQIVLFGQPELDKKLGQKSIRQLRERITHSFNLEPLNVDDIRAYLHFRLQSAGCPWPQLFSPKAERLLGKASTGLTRRINILADKSLLAAYADPAIQPEARSGSGEILPMVLPRHVKIAITDSGYKSIGSSLWGRWLGYGSAAFGGAFVVVLAIWLLGIDTTKQSQQFADSAPAVQQDPVINNFTPAIQVTEVVQRVAQQEVQEVAQENVSAAASTPAAAEATQASSQPLAIIEPETVEGAVQVNAQQVRQVQRVVDVESVQQVAEPEATELALQVPVSTVSLASRPASVAPEVEEPVIPLANETAPARADTASTQIALPPASGSAPELDAQTSVIQEPQSWANYSGLTKGRLSASARWLNSIEGEQGYSVQLFSVKTQNSYLLEEFLEFLTLTNLLDESYICLISGNTRREEQWLILHGQYDGLSGAREFIDSLPTYIAQHGPYARNLRGIACANDKLK